MQFLGNNPEGGAGSAAPALAAAPPRWRRMAPYTLLGVALLLAYFPALCAYFLSDDYVLLTEAQLRRSFLETLTVDPTWFFYRPLGKLLWFVEFHLFGYRAALYHAVSLGLHMVNSLLVIALARRYLTAGVALVAGVLFALLPLHAEAVVWLACQYDLLATCGFLAALICLDLFWERSMLWWYLLALGMFQVSLWSKEVAFMFPLVAGMLAILGTRRPESRHLLRALLPFGLLLGLNLLQRYLAWGSFGGYGGVALQAQALPQTLVSTVATLLAPLNQLVFPGWLVRAWLFVNVLILVVGSLVTPTRRVVLVAISWMALTLLPVLGLLPPSADMQNSRVLYLPAVGLCLWLAAAACALTPRTWPAVGILMALAWIVVMPWQIGPWRVAGENSLHVVQELHRLIPGFPPGSRLTVAGMPDNYKGAYVYRLGLNHSFGHHFHATFALEEVPKLPPLRYDLAGDESQVAFGFDSVAQRWGITQARLASTAGGRVEAVAGWQHWDLTQCPAEWRFDSACVVGEGVRLGENGMLESSPFAAPADGWVEIVAEVRTAAAQPSGELTLAWRSPTGQWIADSENGFNLAADGSRRAYHFYLNPGQKSQSLGQIRFVGSGTSGVVVSAVALRAIP